MNFIISLFILNNYNTIYILVDYFTKKYYYTLYIVVDKRISIKIIIDILLNYIFYIYSLLNLIVLNRGL